MNNADAFRRAQIDLKNRERLLNNRFGDMSPIDNNKLPNMPQGSVVILSDEIKEILKLIQQKTTREKKEIPFFLYGKTKGQTVFFNHIDADLDNLSGVEADFSSLISELQNFINNSKKDGTDIVAHGHSHPETSNYYRNFSLGDMNAYKTTRLNNEVFRTGKIELCCAG